MRKYILKKFCILIYGMNTTSCTDSYQQMLLQTLEQAEDRKRELEKAISYNSQEKDSHKQKAKFFLIKDMYAQYAYHSPQMDTMNRAINLIDTVLTQQTNP